MYVSKFPSMIILLILINFFDDVLCWYEEKDVV